MNPIRQLVCPTGWQISTIWHIQPPPTFFNTSMTEMLWGCVGTGAE